MAKTNKEKRIEELSKLTVAELASNLYDAEEEIQSANKALADEETAHKKTTTEKELAEKTLADEKTAHEKTKEKLEATLQLNDELQVKAEKGNPKQLPIVTVNKEKYQVTMPAFQWAGTIYKAAQLEKDPDLCKVLVKEGSSVLKLIEE